MYRKQDDRWRLVEWRRLATLISGYLTYILGILTDFTSATIPEPQIESSSASSANSSSPRSAIAISSRAA